MNNIPVDIWERLLRMFPSDSGETLRSLQSATLLAQMTNVAYTHRRAFKIAKGRPYSLAVGNVDQNLKDLAATGPDEYDNLVTRKIYQLDDSRGTCRCVAAARPSTSMCSHLLF